MPILWFLKPMFLCSERLVCYIKRRKSFFTIYFHDYDMGIQGVTRGYRRLQGVTRGYKGLQGVTRGYRGLIRGYKGDRG